METIILDIRTKKEYCDGHLCNSILVETPLPPLLSEQIKKLYYNLSKITQSYKHKNVTFLVYCKKGIRASFAVHFLKNMGFDAYSLIGLERPNNLLKKYIQQGLCYCSKL